MADDQPFVAIEKEEFRELIEYLWSDAKIPTADTIRSDLNITFTKAKAFNGLNTCTSINIPYFDCIGRTNDCFSKYSYCIDRMTESILKI